MGLTAAAMSEEVKEKPSGKSAHRKKKGKKVKNSKAQLDSGL